MDMSNRTIDSVLMQLRLLARANVVCDQNGHKVYGEINPVIEELRMMLSDAWDSVSSIVQLSEEQLQLLHTCVEVCSVNREVIHALEREVI
jgi:hypothetical protein